MKFNYAYDIKLAKITRNAIFVNFYIIIIFILKLNT